MAQGRLFTFEEWVGARSLSFDEWHALYPDRNYQAWCDARRRTRIPQKFQQEIEEATGEETAALLDVMPGHYVPIFRDLVVGRLPDPDEFFDIAPGLSDFLNSLDPITRTAVIEIQAEHPVGILWASCGHLLGRYTNHEKFRAIFDRLLAMPRLYMASLGDEVEGFLPSHYPEGVQNQLFPEKFQRVLLRSMVGKLAAAEKILCGTWSQHTGKWHERLTGDNPYKQIYHDHGVPYFDGIGQIDLVVGQQTYHVGLGHNLPGHSMWNEVHAMTRALRFRWPSADIVVRGDKHTYQISEVTAYRDEFDAGRRNSPFAWLLAAGTAKDGPDPYTLRGWERGIFEWPITILWPDRYHIEATRSLDTAELLLTNN